MSVAITFNGALAEQLQREAQAQHCSVEELVSYFLRQSQNEHKRRETLAAIRQLSERIAKEFKPEKIILFGSYAYGLPREGSDIDLLVIMPCAGRNTEQAIKILNTLEVVLPVDLLVRTPAEIEQRLVLGDSFIREIVERGKVLYEAGNAGMD
jgi:predicted nucleotidyltransferase